MTNYYQLNFGLKKLLFNTKPSTIKNIFLQIENFDTTDIINMTFLNSVKLELQYDNTKRFALHVGSNNMFVEGNKTYIPLHMSDEFGIDNFQNK